MVNYSQLPKYTNLHILSNQDILFWDKKIDSLKRGLINKLLNNESPKFKSSYDIDFNKAKQWINDDFSLLVKYFLISIRELKNSNLKQSKALVAILIGKQQKEDLIEFEEGGLVEDVDYGHLKRLQEIYLEFQQTQNMFYLEMMKTLCRPYLDVMKDIIYYCKDLFTGGSEFDFFKDEGQDDLINM